MAYVAGGQAQNFNLRCVLFCRGNQGRLFQQNRPEAVTHKAGMPIGTARSISSLWFLTQAASGREMH